MRIDQAAAQLYTVRDSTKNAVELAATLAKIRAVGYGAVQVSGIGPIEAHQVARLLEGEGLTCCATHEPAAMIVGDPERVIERLQILGCRYTAYPYPHVPLKTKDDVLQLAELLEAAAQKLKDAGITLCYHNHHVEFRRIGNQLLLEILLNAAPSLQGEIDTYWVQYGGDDCVAWCKRLSNRLPLIHLKDYGIGEDNQPVMAEIGYGNMNMAAIVAAAELAGCEWFIVEQDTCPGDPVASLQLSFEYIRDRLAT